MSEPVNPTDSLVVKLSALLLESTELGRPHPLKITPETNGTPETYGITDTNEGAGNEPSPATLDNYIPGLTSPNPATRFATLTEVATLSNVGLPNTRNPSKSWASTHIHIPLFNTPSLIPTLLTLATPPSPVNHQSLAFTILYRIARADATRQPLFLTPSLVPTIVSAIHSPYNDVRINACRCIQNIATDENSQPLYEWEGLVDGILVIIRDVEGRDDPVDGTEVDCEAVTGMATAADGGKGDGKADAETLHLKNATVQCDESDAVPRMSRKGPPASPTGDGAADDSTLHLASATVTHTHPDTPLDPPPLPGTTVEIRLPDRPLDPPPGRIFAYTALVNLAIATCNVRAMFLHPTLISTVLHTIESDKHEEAVSEACVLLNNISMTPDNSRDMFNHPTLVDLLFGVMETVAGNARADACLTIYNLSCTSSNAEQMYRKPGLLDKLLNAAAGLDRKTCRPAVETILCISECRNLSDEESEGVIRRLFTQRGLVYAMACATLVAGSTDEAYTGDGDNEEWAADSLCRFAQHVRLDERERARMREELMEEKVGEGEGGLVSKLFEVLGMPTVGDANVVGGGGGPPSILARHAVWFSVLALFPLTLETAGEGEESPFDIHSRRPLMNFHPSSDVNPLYFSLEHATNPDLLKLLVRTKPEWVKQLPAVTRLNPANKGFCEEIQEAYTGGMTVDYGRLVRLCGASRVLMEHIVHGRVVLLMCLEATKTKWEEEGDGALEGLRFDGRLDARRAFDSFLNCRDCWQVIMRYVN